jgi:uncharacterized protein (DUF952 family)
METIIVTTTEEFWQAAQVAGTYERSTIDTALTAVGFIHATSPDQTIDMVNRHFGGRDDIVFLLVDSSKVKAPVKYEAAPSGRPGLFPHIYGPLNIDAVYATVRPEKDQKGIFTTPKELQEL